ncbi:ATP-dependent DNA helicase [Pseudactinotalea sp. HY158]|uniref:ATP-dependent DNA helicase n=1 Tax=unclassified Pseudactinotalea TaxID=2649176 RepID=UPI00351A2B79
MSGADVDEVLDSVVSAMAGSRREGQHEMARAVSAAVAGGGRLLVQAGTGTGKSIAYLLPTLLHTIRTGERAVVSTATLALQRQIVGVDLPRLEPVVTAAAGRAPEVALLKGWHNYLCKHKLAGGYPDEEEALFSSEGLRAEDHAPPAGESDPGEGGRERSGLAAQVLRLRDWAATSETGDRDDLPAGVSDRAWRQVSISALECLGQKCPLLDECFPEAARRRSREADVVITNHAMLGVAASGSPRALPEHDVLIIDEAHELPSRVTSQATVELSGAAVERVARLARRHAGLATTALDEGAAALREALAHAQPGRWPRGLPIEVNAAARAIDAGTREVLTALRESRGAGKGDQGGTLMARSALVELAEVTDRLLSDSIAENRDVVWCEAPRQAGEAPRIMVAPLEVAGRIAGELLGEKAVVCTSATLTLGGRFEPVAAMIGLAGDYEGIEVASPFDYRAQGIVYVAKHLPPPGREGPSDQLLDEVAELITAAGGRTLGLFSSRRAAEAVAEVMRERLEVPILVQGEDSIGSLVRRFIEDDASCLFGTLTLWQGVDVPGDTCRLVLMDRIPFPRPDDPVMSARSDAVKARGGNGFMQVAAAHAALLLAQGAGRLIRGVGDRGVVAVLDPRLATARYGSFLAASLPPLWPTTDPALVRAALTRLREGS